MLLLRNLGGLNDEEDGEVEDDDDNESGKWDDTSVRVESNWCKSELVVRP